MWLPSDYLGKRLLGTRIERIAAEANDLLAEVTESSSFFSYYVSSTAITTCACEMLTSPLDGAIRYDYMKAKSQARGLIQVMDRSTKRAD